MRPTSKTAVFGSCWVKPSVACERWTSLTWLIEGSRIVPRHLREDVERLRRIAHGHAERALGVALEVVDR